MSARRLIAVALVASTAGLCAWAAAIGQTKEPTRQAPYTKALPAGKGVDLVQANCLLCHSAMLITQQHKDSLAWAKSVQTMVNWGARLTPSDQAIVVGYLARNFGKR